MKDLLRTLLRAGLPVLALFSFLAPAHAQFSEGGSSPTTGSTSSPGEDVGTVPATYDDPDDTLGDLGSHLILVGRPRELGMAIQGVHGSGLVAFSPFAGGGEVIRVRISGDVRVSLDLRAVQAFGIEVFFEVDQGASWTAQVGYGAWTSRSFQLPGGRSVAVPLGSLRPWRAGPISIDAASGSASARLSASLVGSSFRLKLRTRG